MGALGGLALLSARGARDSRLATIALVLAQDKMNALHSESWGSTGAFHDYLDSRGQALDEGGPAGDGTVFVRRWSVTPLASDPDTVRLQVVVSVNINPSLQARLSGLRTRKVGG